MYAIIYWSVDEDYIYTLDNKNKSVHVFATIKEADDEAIKLEKNLKLDTRVVSLDGVIE